jgi:hypothetical protein
MESNLNNLQQKINANGKELVDNEKAAAPGVPGPAKRSIRGLDWTSILRKAKLESPGYHETIEKMKEDGRLGKSL